MMQTRLPWSSVSPRWVVVVEEEEVEEESATILELECTGSTEEQKRAEAAAASSTTSARVGVFIFRHNPQRLPLSFPSSGAEHVPPPWLPWHWPVPGYPATRSTGSIGS